jgi:hypothetical protein
VISWVLARTRSSRCSVTASRAAIAWPVSTVRNAGADHAAIPTEGAWVALSAVTGRQQPHPASQLRRHIDARDAIRTQPLSQRRAQSCSALDRPANIGPSRGEAADSPARLAKARAGQYCQMARAGRARRKGACKEPGVSAAVSGREGGCNAARGSAERRRSRGAWSRVAGMQAKLHHWAPDNRGRGFDDLFSLVHDPATLKVTFGRSRTTGALILPASTAYGPPTPGRPSGCPGSWTACGPPSRTARSGRCQFGSPSPQPGGRLASSAIPACRRSRTGSSRRR